MSTAKFDTLSNLAGTQSVPVETVAQGSAKAWVNFDGTGTVAIRASFNVSSITDNGTGEYTVNFTNALQDANYAITGFASRTSLIDPAPCNGIFSPAPTTTACTVQAGNTANSLNDALFFCVAIFR